jgi:zinc and cadmium transporter
MPSLLFWILGSTLLVCVISLIGIVTLVIRDRLFQRILLILVGFSAGALIGGAFLHLLPEALEHSVSVNVFSYLIVGFAVFFLLERFLYWRHCHKGKCDVHIFTYLNLIGDGIHNFIDGLTIAASFIINIQIGVVTTLAVVSHEIPQELGDFGVLVYGGFSKFKALFYNLLSALTAIFGAITGYFLFPFVENFGAFILPFAAGGFIYIASSDLIPELHREASLGRASSSFVFFLAGILLMAIVKLVFQH